MLTVALTVLAPRIGRPAESVETSESNESSESNELDAPDGSITAAMPGDRPGSRWPHPQLKHVGITAVALVALWAVFLVSAVPVSRRWVNARTVHYVRNLQAGIRAQDAKGPFSVYTTFVPGDINSASFGRYSLVTRVGQLVSGHPISADDLSKPMFMVDAHGNLLPARFQALATVPDACGTIEQKRVMHNLNRPLAKGYWTVQLSYRVPAKTTLRFAVNTGTAVQEATGGFRGFTVTGTGRITFSMRLQSVTAFRFDSGHPGDCISDIKIGRPVPAH